MIELIRDRSINSKLMIILMFSVIFSMLLVGLCLVVLEVAEFKRNALDDFQIMAQGIATRSNAALTFDDVQLARENLSILSSVPSVQAACIYNDKGAIFSQLDQMPGVPACPLIVEASLAGFHGLNLVVVEPINLDGAVIGSIYIHADLQAEFWLKLKFIGTLVLVLLVSATVSFLMAKPLLKLISTPIDALVDTVRQMTFAKDFSLRATKINDDELGVLVDAFNRLMVKVEQQNLALTQSKDLYLALYDDNPTIIFNAEQNGHILSVNLTGANQLGFQVSELQKHSIYDFVYSEDLAAMRKFIERCIDIPTQVHHHEIRKVCGDGQIILVRETARVIENENQQLGLLIVCEDITETQVLNEKIAYQASHDVLTGLANRRQFEDVVNQIALKAQVDESEHALCYLDIDQFKVVNDTFGHLAGDELIKQLSELLRKHLRREDMIARLGGDEFGVLILHCSFEFAMKACENLRQVISDFHFLWENNISTVTASIGIVAINSKSSQAIELFKEVDAACYAAKDRGRNRVHVFSPDDTDLAMRQGEMQWVRKIQQGLEQNRFRLFGQPIVDCAGEGGLHFETLIRYCDEKDRIIPPGAFLPAAERYNLSPLVDRWVISQLFAWLAERPEFLDELALCSINLSGLSISDESMLEFIFREFEKWDIPTHKICFEVTETAAIANLSYAIKFINSLKELGCLFSLDDFGSGLSSFAYLKNLPVDFLKIDGLFVKEILNDKVDLAMVKSINEVGHVLGKKTIAEFVENKEIFDLLKELGVDFAQGYGIGKPMPLDKLETMMPLLGEFS
ncbi:MAG: EAL domain-containing protein [Methylococcaceae bacterium]|jgi:diguanylate cyclase (GGDEF)-like protein/PAS domain S-box-containing protein